MGRAAGLVAAAPVLLDLPAPGRDPEQVREAVREVLSRPEYRQSGRPLLERAWTWLLDRLGELLAAIVGTATGSIVGLVLVLLIVAAIIVLATRFARGLTPDPEVAAAIRAAPRRGAGEWRAEAEAHERAGEWRQAVRCRYRALVADLASRGLVEEVPGRTAGEYRGQVGRNLPAAAGEFGGATELFERAWYGRRPTREDEAARFRDLAGRVLERAGT